MPFKSRAQKSASIHDKSNSTYREASKHKHFEEKKDMEHELQTIETDIKNAINGRYEHFDTKVVNRVYEVTFINKILNDKKVFKIVYGENYDNLKKNGFKI